jgi:two-component system response regulator FlrC
MGISATPFTLSAGVRHLHPGLGEALQALGLVPVASGAVLLITPDEAAPAARYIRVGAARTPSLLRNLAPLYLAHIQFDAGDLCFAAALIRALLRGPMTPTAVDPSSRALLGMAERVAPRDVSVLINGPTGTGKEVLAQYIHDCSPRRDCPLVAVNCAALPESMLEALLFGHERGAFTGASAAAKGLFRAAQGGTLLLDEIAELPLALQAKLLRALQEREVLPVGATVATPVDVRIIAAANRDLAAEVAAGRFRSDLYYRLAVFPMATQKLAERVGDIPALAAALLLRACKDDDSLLWPTPDAVNRLARAAWPGNVRELDNVLQRALVMAAGTRIEANDLIFDLTLVESAGSAPLPSHPELPSLNNYAQHNAALGGMPLGGLVRARESDAIRAVLEQCAGRRTEAAQRLGISERTLRYKLAAMSALRKVAASAAPQPTMQ